MSRAPESGRQAVRAARWRGLLALEQGVALYRADFAFYGLLVAGLALAVLATLPTGGAWAALAWAAAGAGGWTLAEYGLHRHVLHGLQPFKRWHALHHARPLARINAPTLLTATLFAGLVAAPAWWWASPVHALALVFGVLAAYLAYGVAHHAVHHFHGRSRWLHRRKRWHALHHREGARACYGVSLSFWDHVFGTARPQARPPVRQRTDAAPARPYNRAAGGEGAPGPGMRPWRAAPDPHCPTHPPTALTEAAP